MTKDELFIDGLRQMTQSTKEPAIVQGKAVNVTDTMCDVELVGAEGLTLTDVLYTATEGNANGFRLVPLEGTNVLVSFVGDDINSPYLVAMDKVAKVLVLASGAELSIDDAGKVALLNGSAGLKEILAAIIEMVKTLTVSTAMGPSGTPLPPTIQQATQLETDISALFK